MKVVCFHLYNDFSGSPKVLRMVLEGLTAKNIHVELVTSRGRGALSELSKYGVRIFTYPYRFSQNPVLTMIQYVGVQFYLFFFALRYTFSRQTVFYINTILPIGAAIAGRLIGKQVIYHYHENAFVKGAFYKLLARAMQMLASRIICVSEYQRSFLRRQKNVHVVPNAVPVDFVQRLSPSSNEAFDRKCILMLGSLKRYKGIFVFMDLAKQLPDYSFELVLNENAENVSLFRQENHIGSIRNLKVYSRQSDVAPFYNRASVVLNLSNKDLSIETFGLTALEAMSAGLPVIVPTVGGIAEMVENGVNGYKIDCSDLESIEEHIRQLLSNKDLYCRLSDNAFQVAHKYNEQAMIDKIAFYFH